MAGYSDTRKMIIDTLMGRPEGTQIQPEDHQAFALQITDYIRSVELVAGNATPIGFADADTVPVQPYNGQAIYLSSVSGSNTITFTNFIDQNGNAISVTSTANVIKLITLLWNGQYWSSQVTSVNAVCATDGYLFAGVATPSTNPGTPEQKMFYIAGEGEYPNFGYTIDQGKIGVFYYDTSWHLSTLTLSIADGAVTSDKLDVITRTKIDKAVRVNETQSFTFDEKTQARQNIDAPSKDGNYPLMSVGSANNLTGGMSVSREFTEDTAGGSADIADGIVKVERIKGNSIVWRNLIPRMRVVDKAIENWMFYGAPVVTETSNEITFTNAEMLQPLPSFRSALIVGRKYYWIVRAKSSNANNYVYCAPLRGGAVDEYKVADEWVTISAFGVPTQKWTDRQIRFHQENPTDTTTIDKRIGMVLIDVSSIEESTGKEFQIKSDFESWLAHSGFENYFGYSAGEIFNLNPTAIKTVGFNAYNHTTGKAYVIGGNQYQITGAYTSITEDGVTITPDSNGKFTPTKNGELVIAGGDSTTTCVHLVWSGKRDGEYEEHWEETRNIPVTQINTDGTITESAEGKTRLFPDGLCSVGEYIDEVTPVKAIKRIGARAYEEGDEEDISVLTDGTTTLYALAIPVVVEFTEPLNLNYRVSDFGTETLLPINDATPVTTPIKIDVEYGLNVVDTVRNLSRNYLGMSGTQNTFAAIAAALSAYGMSMTLGDYDETNKYYPVTISGGWKPANVAPTSATAAGNKGEYYIDADYFYVCVDNNTWKRFALSW